MLLYRPLLDAEYQTSMKSMWLLEPVSKKITFHFRPLKAYHYLPEAIIYSVLFSDMVSINYLNVIKSVRALLEETVTLCLKASLKGRYFRSWHAHIHRASPCGG
jgi:hypothetical protein